MPTRPRFIDSPKFEGGNNAPDQIFVTPSPSKQVGSYSSYAKSSVASSLSHSSSSPLQPNPPEPDKSESSANTYTPSRPEEFEFDVDEVLEIPLTAVNQRGQNKQTRYQLMPFSSERIYDSARSTLSTTSVLMIMIVIAAGLLIGSFFGYDSRSPIRAFLPENQNVAKAQEVTTEFMQWANLQGIDTSGYDSTGASMADPTLNLRDEDPDSDQLSNYNEFVLGSNPLNSQSCSTFESDSRALNELINPGTCREVDWTISQDVRSFISVFTQTAAYTAFIDSFNPEKTDVTRVAETEDGLDLNQIEPSSIDAYFESIDLRIPEGVSGELIVWYASKHALKPELLVALIQYQSQASETASLSESNNITGVGSNELADYTFGSAQNSIATTARILQYLTIRGVPDCAKLSLVRGGDVQACKVIEPIYRDIKLS